jgi:hypothetical protein
MAFDGQFWAVSTKKKKKNNNKKYTRKKKLIKIIKPIYVKQLTHYINIENSCYNMRIKIEL